MTDQNPKDKLREFYKELVLALVAAVRSLSLYPPEHPESEKKLEGLFKRLDLYLSQRPSLTLLLLGNEVIVEDMPLPELTKLLPKLLQRLDAIHLERLLFRQGLSAGGADRFLTTPGPASPGPEGWRDGACQEPGRDSPTFWQAAFLWNPSRRSPTSSLWMCSSSPVSPCSSFSAQLKELFSDVEGPLPSDKVSLAKGA